MRVAIDCRSVFAGCGGIGRYTTQLVKAIARIDRDTDYYLVRTKAKNEGPIVEQDNVYEIVVSAGMLDENFEQLHLPQLLESYEIDLYHNTTFSLPIVQPCVTVTTIHDVVFHFRPDLVRPGLNEYLAKWSRVAAETATRIITVSQYSKAAICDAYGVDPAGVSVIHEAADAERFRPRYGGALEIEFRKCYDISGPFVLYVGSLEPKKNIDRLLAAFKRARRDSRLPHRLVLAGGGGGMDYDVQAAIEELGLEQLVTVTGYLPDRYLPVAYNAADLFAYLSLYEGFGLPPLEAMACGTPTLVTDCTSLPEVVGTGAVRVSPTDPDEIAAALAWMLTDRALQEKLRERGPERAAQFSWQRAALETLEVYRMCQSRQWLPAEAMLEEAHQ